MSSYLLSVFNNLNKNVAADRNLLGGSEALTCQWVSRTSPFLASESTPESPLGFGGSCLGWWGNGGMLMKRTLGGFKCVCVKSTLGAQF